ncbi:MAG TPA: helix-hairpin-helix domain-containing protein, partial [Anaerolinea sp.]|nr:helix-hairpin-helix domain-containing protein [Anaerolinea sp.]
MFQNEENGYTIARLNASGSQPEITVVGNLMGVNIGERLRLDGMWINHPQYGRQFEIHRFAVEYPATIEGLCKYLGSGMIRGIGPVTATKIVDRFGLDTLDVIDNEPERLKEVDGIGEQKVLRIAAAWREQRQVKEIMLFLQSNGISTGLAVRIYKQYGDEAIRVVRNDPYRLAKDIYGIGFKTADKIAVQLGIPPDHPSRLQAGIIYALNQMTNEGHCFALSTDLLNSAAGLLESNPALCQPQLDILIRQTDLIAEDEAIYLPPFHYAELGVANRIKRIRGTERDRLAVFRRLDLDSLMGLLQQPASIRLTDQQILAVKLALTEKISIITGGPGTGKSTITDSIVKMLRFQKP